MTKLSRRAFLERAALLGAAAVAGPALLAACNSGGGGGEGGGGGLTCTDTTGLTDAEIQMRTSLNYVDASATDGQNCQNCSLYTAGAEGECGGCTLLKGPIHPEGWCSSWAAAS